MHAAPQHGPRPLPLFIDMLRSETAQSPERRRAALAGLERYQSAVRVPRPEPMPVLVRAGRACLRDYGGAGPAVVVVPSLINPPFVLDMAPEASLLRWLAGRGSRVLLVDWGEPTPADRDQDVTAHVESLLLPMLRTLPEPPTLVGYCLGGTIATAAAGAIRARGLALIATPWHFAGFGEGARIEVADLWTAAAPACEAMGLVPMEVLQSGFWRLDPARTVAKFEALGGANDDVMTNFVMLEDWANAGAPLTLAAGRQMFERFFGTDDPGGGRWTIEGSVVDPTSLPCPIIDFVSIRDRIVPAATSIAIGERRDIDAGHVGMVVGSRARTALWEPLAGWLSTVAGTR